MALIFTDWNNCVESESNEAIELDWEKPDYSRTWPYFEAVRQALVERGTVMYRHTGGSPPTTGTIYTSPKRFSRRLSTTISDFITHLKGLCTYYVDMTDTTGDDLSQKTVTNWSAATLDAYMLSAYDMTSPVITRYRVQDLEWLLWCRRALDLLYAFPVPGGNYSTITRHAYTNSVPYATIADAIAAAKASTAVSTTLTPAISSARWLYEYVAETFPGSGLYNCFIQKDSDDKVGLRVAGIAQYCASMVDLYPRPGTSVGGAVWENAGDPGAFCPDATHVGDRICSVAHSANEVTSYEGTIPVFYPSGAVVLEPAGWPTDRTTTGTTVTTVLVLTVHRFNETNGFVFKPVVV